MARPSLPDPIEQAAERGRVNDRDGASSPATGSAEPERSD